MDHKDTPKAVRRKGRRSEAALRELIVAAALEEFRRHGYDGARTKTIAERAQVSESLIFRYFGDKTGLLHAASLLPFLALIEQFRQSHGEPENINEHREGTRQFVKQLAAHVRKNRQFLARALQPGEAGGTQAGARMLHDYFAHSVDVVRRLQPRLARGSGISAELTVRLGFGFVVGTILLSDWLFDNEPDPDELEQALVHFLERSVVP